VQVTHQKSSKSPPRPFRHALKPLLFLVLSACLLPVRAEDTPVPADLQAAIFQKVFSYDRTLPNGTSPEVVIAFSANSVKLKDSLLKAFEGLGIKASAQLDADIKSMSGIHVLYVATEGKSFRQLCQQNGVLSITGFPSLVEKGEVAVGLDASGDKPKIVVHRKQLKAEGHELDAHLLRLARLID